MLTFDLSAPTPYPMSAEAIRCADLPPAERRAELDRLLARAGVEALWAVEPDVENLIAWRADPAAYARHHQQLDAALEAADGVIK